MPRLRHDRMATLAEVARLFRRKPKEFEAIRATYEAAGMPKPLPDGRLYDPVAVDAWLDRIGGVAPASAADSAANDADDDPFLAKLRARDHEKAALRPDRPS